ncbi:MAG: hypothetical protein WCP21_12430 [Armatimonadota bacterium]
MVNLQVFITDPADPSPVAAMTLQRVRAAAGRFGRDVAVTVLALDDEAALERGLGMEPAVLVGELLVAVGQAPPAGHLVRAIETALQREKSQNV